MRRVTWSLALAWLFLWLLSTGYRGWHGFERAQQVDQTVLSVTVDPSIAPKGSLNLAYRDMNIAAPAEVSWLLLHGNPVAGRTMLPLADALGAQRRILIPDLPGLGYSERALTSYSAENQVSVLLPWLETLGVDRVHVLGYSQGSAVALELVDRAPEKVVSVSLLAGVGLQAHELLGSYEWNQPLYAAHYAFLWSLRWLTPHFGWLDAPAFSTTTALNFADTDLRRNRAILERLEHPVLILHSVKDRLVPYAAAKAHAEMLPQARFIEMPGGHLGAFSDTEVYATEANRFVASVEAGKLSHDYRSRGAALALEVPPTQSIIQDLLIASLLATFVFFSEDLACIAGGILAAAGTVSLTAAILGCFFGIFISDVLLYWLGRILGEPVFKIGFVARAAEGGTFLRLKDRFDGNVFKIVFMTRFIPGSRVIAYVTAGVLKVKFPRFACSLAIAAAVWTPILVGIAYFAGRPLIVWWEQSGWVVLPLVLVGIFLIYLGITILVKALTYRGRCSLRGRWLRLTRWEFWPALPVYFPVFFYGCYLAVKHRGSTLWAMCNPGMQPLSGLALESKSEILAALNSEAELVADWACIQASDTVEPRMVQLDAFRREQVIDWPLVLKPDVGQRGEGVAVIRNVADARHYLAANHEPVIAQRFIPGAEFGVFYYRMPGDVKGQIFSITEKVLPELTGDGIRTIERLILDDARAVAQAKHYLKVNADRLEAVPAQGDKVRLVELGTHCRGAIFLDGNRFASETLAARLDDLLSSYEGFYFGRFDLRVPSGERMQAGEAFKILELNGVSSESTDIYDPKNSLLAGWRKLCRQWRLAFEIGAANRDAGAQVVRWSEIFSVLRGHRAREPYEVD
jgi:membrane protein DedA with SNARE-associated domain/pimeloyl-ACP methyl ester carboxylesterase